MAFLSVLLDGVCRYSGKPLPGFVNNVLKMKNHLICSNGFAQTKTCVCMFEEVKLIEGLETQPVLSYYFQEGYEQ